jgi:methyl-accepting chemotaxis protein
MHIFPALGIRGKIFLSLATELVFVLLLVGMVYRSIQASERQDRFVTHTYQVIGAIDDLQLQLVNMQTGVRGFLLTGEQRFLDPYTNGSQRYAQIYGQLYQLISDNPEQQQRLQQIDAAVQVWRTDVLEPIIARRRTAAPTLCFQMSIRI